MNKKSILVAISGLLALVSTGSLASATETFDCSINNHRWELMAHYGSHGEVTDIILFISDSEKYSYSPSKDEVTINNKQHQFILKISDRSPDTPGIEIHVSDGSGSVLFKGNQYDIQCTWNDE